MIRFSKSSFYFNLYASIILIFLYSNIILIAALKNKNNQKRYLYNFGNTLKKKKMLLSGQIFTRLVWLFCKQTIGPGPRQDK